MVRREIEKIIEKALENLYKKKIDIEVEQPAELSFGDYATNAAMLLKKNPQQITEAIKSPILEKVEVRNGFINFFLSKEYLQKQVKEILRKKEKYGSLKIGKKKKINVEFISANPTGPLHVGNARGGFCGDVLSNVLEKAGYKPFREYYINDKGRQIEILKNSLEGKEPSYKNPYIDELKKKGIKDVKRAVNFIIKKIKQTTERMGIKYDKWFFESDLYKKKEIDKILNFLKRKKLIYEKEGAIWFKSTKFGDDKDRVLLKTGEKETYFLSDIAYLRNKFRRGFSYLIMFLGAEHHGYAPRLKAGAISLGFKAERVKPIIYQLVKLREKGRELRMSKRTGIYITIDELIDEVGVDISRFFFLTRNYGNHLIFDLDLAKEQSEKNPVYYIQYAHARICSILRKVKSQKSKVKITNQNLKLLNHPSELALIKQLIRLPEIIEDIAEDYQVQRLPQYATDLATVFHQFYRDCKVLSDDKDLTKARLSLVLATKTVLKNVLDLMGISAPEKM